MKRRYISHSGYPNPLSNKLDDSNNKNSETRLFELGFIPTGMINKETEEKVLKYLDKNLNCYDLVVVSDFGHGFFTKNIIAKIMKEGKRVSINTQTNSSNFGFNLLDKYSNRKSFLCIDELEARLLIKDKQSSIDSVAAKIKAIFPKSSLMITRGKLGLKYYTQGKAIEVPALATKIIDPIGAGDALFTGASIASAFQDNPKLTGFLAAIMGMLGTQIEGNERPISNDEVIRNIKGLI